MAELIVDHPQPGGPTPAPGEGGWHLADIDYAALRRDRVADDRLLFQSVVLASFIETGSNLYARNLVEYFRDDPEVANWLTAAWEREELQHGAALRAYVERAWPEFDWQKTFDAFFDEYSRTCTVPQLEPARALELAARCVVEMGTATLYRTMASYAPEPVLRDLAARIYADEVRHYKHFYRYFRRYQRRENHGRWRIGRTLARRLRATRSDDGQIAYRALWQALDPGCGSTFDDGYRAFRRDVAAVARRYAPRDMPVEMLLKPLRLPPVATSGIQRLARMLYRWWLGG